MPDRAAFSVCGASKCSDLELRLIQHIERSIPNAVVELREHRGWCDCRYEHCDGGYVYKNSILVTLVVGPFKLSREYASEQEHAD